MLLGGTYILYIQKIIRISTQHGCNWASHTLSLSWVFQGFGLFAYALAIKDQGKLTNWCQVCPLEELLWTRAFVICLGGIIKNVSYWTLSLLFKKQKR